MSEQPEGWYRDPHQPNLHRYWDGRDWHPESAEYRFGTTRAATDDGPEPA